jgi:hypothetical protein
VFCLDGKPKDFSRVGYGRFLVHSPAMPLNTFFDLKDMGQPLAERIVKQVLEHWHPFAKREEMRRAWMLHKIDPKSFLRDSVASRKYLELLVGAFELDVTQFEADLPFLFEHQDCLYDQFFRYPEVRGLVSIKRIMGRYMPLCGLVFSFSAPLGG